MEGLIKGLVDVALGHGDARDEPETLEERSRSSWAQVVSGDQDNADPDHNNQRLNQNEGNRDKWSSRPSRSEQHGEGSQDAWNSRPSRRSEQSEGSQDEWNSRPSRRSQQEENVEGNDGWETVGKKHPNQRHKIQRENWNSYKRPSSEQEYSNDVEDSAYLVPSEEELGDLSQACYKLWELDANRLVPGKDYEIDCGEGKKVYQKDDMAQGSLFRWVNDDVLRRPTIARFCSLLDNYNPNEGYKEVVTSEEKQEQNAFIEEISRTAPIKYVHKYLASKGIVSNDYRDFKRILTSLWFDLYGRGGTSGSSSAFEHVFVGEVKQRGEQQVSGFHNWLQFYLEEAKGAVDYQGYIFPRRRGEIPESDTQLLTSQFEWNGVLKSVSSILIGVSPEFEVALYTLCFYVGREDNNVELGPYSVNIKCYRFGDRMGSVFPLAA